MTLSVPLLHAGYIPGAIGAVVLMQSSYYNRHWGFNLYFEANLARELADFLQKLRPGLDGFWVVLVGDRIVGSISVDGGSALKEGARLRWFIVEEGLALNGIGKRLISTAIEFCRVAGYLRIHLWTFEGLNVARRLYEQRGFRLTESTVGTQWGRSVQEQRFELLL